MSLLSKLLNKTPENVTAHIIDPVQGYQTESWTVGSDVSVDTVSRLAAGAKLYVLRVYKAGEMQQIICKKGAWLSAKAKMDAIDKSF